MLSTFVLFGLLALVWSQDSTTTPSEGGSGIFQVEVRTSNIGRIKYEDGEVILSQNQRKPTDIFFTPFPRVDPTSTECRENLLSDHVELTLSVELYTPQLVRAIHAYLKQRFSTLCDENGTCDVSLLPMNAIRLVQKGLRTNKARQMYTINDEWHSNTLLLQSIEFIIYTANQSVCEKLRSSITERCHLSNFEVQYSLYSEKTIERQVDITAEQITGTSMFNRIRSQFQRSDTVALTGDDFKQLISEVTDRITMKVRVQEGFNSQLQDPIGLDKLLERQFQFKQVQLERASDQLWDSLYWTNDLTRPDRLAKAINTIIRKNSTDANHFLYDSQAAKNIHKLGLTQHDIDRFEQLDKLLTTHAHSSSSSNSHASSSQGSGGLSFFGIKLGGSGGRSGQSQSQQSENIQTMADSMHDKRTGTNHLNVTNIMSNNDTQYVLSRADVEKYLTEMSDHVHLEGEIILPKPIDAHLVKLSTLRAETKLLSHTVLVRTRSNVHVLPLRCPPKDSMQTAANATNRYRWLEDKVNQLTATVEQLTNLVAKTEEKWKSRADELNNRIIAVQRTSSDQQKEISNRIPTLTPLESQITEIRRTTSQQSKELENRIASLEQAALTKKKVELCRLGLSEAAGNITQTISRNIIYLDVLQGQNICFNGAPQFFFAYQSVDRFLLNTVSPSFTKIPGLSLVFHHAKPRLYKIRLQGHLYTISLDTRTFVRFMIDDRILISNKLYPNTEQRLRMQLPAGSSDMENLDWRGGIFAFTASSRSTFPCSKTEIVYLPAGVHSIDVVGRTTNAMQAEGFELSVEVIELMEGSTTNLPLLYPK